VIFLKRHLSIAAKFFLYSSLFIPIFYSISYILRQVNITFVDGIICAMLSVLQVICVFPSIFYYPEYNDLLVVLVILIVYFIHYFRTYLSVVKNWGIIYNLSVSGFFVYFFVRILMLPAFTVMATVLYADVRVVSIAALAMSLCLIFLLKRRYLIFVFAAYFLLLSFFLWSDRYFFMIPNIKILIGLLMAVIWTYFLYLKSSLREKNSPYIHSLKIALLCLVSYLLVLGHIITCYNVFLHTYDDITWLLPRYDNNNYDVVADEDDNYIFVAGSSHINRYAKTGGNYISDVTVESLVPNQRFERMDINNLDGRLFFAHYGPFSGEPSVTIYDFNLTPIEILSFPDCNAPLHVLYSPPNRKLFYNCEISGHVIMYDFISKSHSILARFPFPIAMTLDTSKERLYVFTILGGKNIKYNIKDNVLTSYNIVSSTAQGSIHVKSSGKIIVSKMLLGEIDVRDDESLEVTDRIPMGLGVRDLDVDQRNGNIIAANYVTGTIDILHRDSLGKASVTKMFGGPILRGVFFNKKTQRLYFANCLGVGIYKKGALENAYKKQTFIEKLKTSFLISLTKAHV